MPERFETHERLAEAVRAGLPEVLSQWLAPVRARAEILTLAAMDPQVDDETFSRMVREAAAGLPELMEEMGTTRLADYFEAAMGAALANGIAARDTSATVAQRIEQEDSTLQRAGSSPAGGWHAGILPQSIVDAARRRKKRRDRAPGAPRKHFEEALHPRGTGGRFRDKPGGSSPDGRAAAIEWRAADAAEAAVLERLTGKEFKSSARIFASEDALRHVEHGHKQQLSAKDLRQLRGRMFDPRTERGISESRRDGTAVQFNFRRGDDLMEAVFTVHFPHRKSPGELRLKTYKALDPADIERRRPEQ